jgi:carboxypeptidase T
MELSRMKFVTIIVGLFLISSLIIANTPDKVSQIKIYVPDKETLKRIWDSGVDYEGSSGKIGGWMEFIVGTTEREQLRIKGISYHLIYDDLSARALQGLVRGPANALGFGYGSMGGYYTYTEVLSQLDSMRFLFPDLITARESIGTTWQGRATWIVKISDNPDLDEENEPEALYTALTHAREPEGMMTVLYYMWWLLENYGSDSMAAYLVNNRQMWFIPVINPDGYVYNQTNYPSGGGYWRKNMRNNNGSFGVDLNRNFGPEYMWNAPNGGSSTVPSSDTYRGPSPFSEPETYTINLFIWNRLSEGHIIKTCLNYHTYGNYLVNPWGYLDHETEDSLIFRDFSFDLTAENRYIAGTDEQTVNYSTRGGADDFMYGGTFEKTYAMTPEVGRTGFWPSTGEILPLAMQNLNANKYLSLVAGQYTVLKQHEISGSTTDNALLPGESFSLSITLRNKGLGDSPNLHITLSPTVPQIEFTNSVAAVSSLLARTDTTINFSGIVQPECPLLTSGQIIVTTSSDDGYTHHDTISVVVGKPELIFSDSADYGLDNWTTSDSWGVTSKAHTPPTAFTDSPSGNYSAGDDDALTINQPLNLYGYRYCSLKFWTKWEIEPINDFALIEASTNDGATWTTVRSTLSRPASGYGAQTHGLWGYDHYTPELTWVEQEVDLSSFIGQQLLLRFRLVADGSDQRDGWCVDDIRVIGYREPAPALFIKDNGQESGSLYFGEHPSGTDGIDAGTGESELGEKPSSGTFDARWLIPGTNGSATDLRSPLSDIHRSNIFTAEFQSGAGGYPFTVKWDPGLLPPGGWHLHDGVTHGNIININMLADTEVIITDNAISTIELIHSFQDTVITVVNEGWTMVSLPVISSNHSKSDLFPASTSDAFAYAGGYISRDTLEYQTAYWIKYPMRDTISFIGIPITRDTIVVPSGWAMISGIGCPAPTTEIRCSPGPCPSIFVYRTTYVQPSTINPGEGFWIKGPTTIILSSMRVNPISLSKSSSAPELQRMNTLTISDHDGAQSVLYFGNENTINSPLSLFDLPPVPPARSFDARFSTERYVEIFLPENNTNNQTIIRFQSDSYPIKIEWSLQDGQQEQYELIANSTALSGTRLTNNGSVQIDNPEVSSLILQPIHSPVTPTQFALKENYPNPFNPVTTIAFDIPTPSIISLKVINVLGQDVSTIISNQYFTAGGYHNLFDGSTLSSGLYFCQFAASPIDGSPSIQLMNKMILLK